MKIKESKQELEKQQSATVILSLPCLFLNSSFAAGVFNNETGFDLVQGSFIRAVVRVPHVHHVL